MQQDTKAPKFKRTKYFVAKGFQLRYVGIILLLMFLTAAICSTVVYYTSIVLLGEKLASVYPQGRLVSIVRAVNMRILFSVIMITPIVAVIGIYLSHKIAGPIARMERFLAAMAAGDLKSKITLRQGDELVGLADGINNLTSSLRQAILSHKARIDKMLHEIDSLTARPQDQAVIKRLKDEARELSVEFDKFKL